MTTPRENRFPPCSRHRFPPNLVIRRHSMRETTRASPDSILVSPDLIQEFPPGEIWRSFSRIVDIRYCPILYTLFSKSVMFSSNLFSTFPQSFCSIPLTDVSHVGRGHFRFHSKHSNSSSPNSSLPTSRGGPCRQTLYFQRRGTF